MTTDTQEVTLKGGDLGKILAPVFNGTVPAPAKPEQATPSEPAPAAAEPKADTPPAQPVAEKKEGAPPAPAANAAPEPQKVDTPPADPEPKKADDPYAAVVSDVAGTTPEVAAWDENSKTLFKNLYGADDPVEYKKSIDEKLAQGELYKKQYSEVAQVKDALDKLNPTMQKVVGLALSGKVAEAQEYIKSMPKSVLEGKQAKDISDRELIDSYFPGKVKPEHWAALADPETDDDVADALKTRIGLLREAAEGVHEDVITKAKRENEEAIAASQKQYENFQNGVAASLTAARNSPLRAFVDDAMVDEFRTGAYLGRFVQEDGVTPTPESTTLLLKALHFDPAVKAAEARGYERGKTEALLEATSRQPATPRVANRDTGDIPQPVTVDDQTKNILLQVHQRG